MLCSSIEFDSSLMLVILVGDVNIKAEHKGSFKISQSFAGGLRDRGFGNPLFTVRVLHKVSADAFSLIAWELILWQSSSGILLAVYGLSSAWCHEKRDPRPHPKAPPISAADRLQALRGRLGGCFQFFYSPCKRGHVICAHNYLLMLYG